MEGDTDDSVDEELEESLPICVQGSLTRLRSDKFTLSTSNKTLRRQLEESRLWSRELEGQVRELKDRVADLDNKLSEETSQCQRLQVQLDEVGERLGSGQLSFTGDNQDVTREEAARASVETEPVALVPGVESDHQAGQADVGAGAQLLQQVGGQVQVGAPRVSYRLLSMETTQEILQ